MCFLKEHRGAYFCPTYIEGSVLWSTYGLDSICRFYYICGQLHLSAFIISPINVVIDHKCNYNHNCNKSQP